MTDTVTGGERCVVAYSVTGGYTKPVQYSFCKCYWNKKRNVKCTAKAIRWTQQEEESLAVFQYVYCHSADSVLKTEVFQLIICMVVLNIFTY